jgi:hypothetical protein
MLTLSVTVLLNIQFIGALRLVPRKTCFELAGGIEGR